MRYQDCPGCSCLVGVAESSCPFCGQVLRSVAATGWLTLGLVLTLGTVSISCGEKDGNTTDTVTAGSDESQGPDSNGDTTDPNDPSVGVTYAGPDEDSITDPTGSSGGPHTTVDSTPDGSTYAGPDESASATEGSTGEGSTGDTGSGSTGSTGEGSTSTSTTTDSDSDSNGDGATYAGADVPD